MGWFFVALILFVIALGFFGASRNAYRSAARQRKRMEEGKFDSYTQREMEKGAQNREGTATVFMMITVAGVLLGLLFFGASTFTIVSARTVGVPVTFGNTGDPIKSGPEFKGPFTKVVEVDTVEQVDNWNNGDKEDIDHKTINVQLGNGSTADAYISLTWKLNGDEASDIYATYRDDDPTALVYERLVSPSMKQSVQEVLATYDPTTPVTETATEASFVPDYAAYSEEIKKNFTAAVAKRGTFIKIVDLKFSQLKLDKDTQKRINQYQAEIQKTKIAEQSVKTAEQQAAANKKLADSLAKQADGAEIYCLSLIEQGKFDPPIGFSCAGGNNGNLILPGGSR